MGFSFDIDDPRLPHGYAGGDATRSTERVATDIHHGKAVDLSDFPSVSVNEKWKTTKAILSLGQRLQRTWLQRTNWSSQSVFGHGKPFTVLACLL